MKNVIILILALAGFATASDAQAQEFQVVVNASNPVSELSRDQVSQIFQKKVGKVGGQNAAPVDQTSGSAVRGAFSQAVHGRSASAIESYWQQQIFAGRGVPPEQKSTDAAVLEFVRNTPGAIGYVAAGASLGAGVKAVKVTG